MVIAFISYEFPPETAYGGVATYIFQATKMLAERGNHIEVFCPSFINDSTEVENGLLVHRIKCDRVTFTKAVLTKFAERNNIVKFNLVESPEYGADGIEVFKNFPDIASVVKTHTPTFLLDIINPGYKLSFFAKTRMIIGALRRANLKLLKPKSYLKQYDDEYLISQLANYVTTPSKSLGEIIAKEWLIEEKKILLQPNPYIPNKQLLEIPIEKTSGKIVTFIGRLEIRKGLLVIKDAIPEILKVDPEITFHFIGKPMYSPDPNYNMEEYLKLKLKPHVKNLKFHGLLNLSSIAELLKNTEVCVFPSIWENFPNVCLESMSAGRAVIGTNSGGMAEQLSDDAGILIPPNDANALKNAVLELIGNPDKRVAFGESARRRVLESYNSNVIGELMERQYQTIIKSVNGKS